MKHQVMKLLYHFLWVAFLVSCSSNQNKQEKISSVKEIDTLPLSKKWEFAIPNQEVPKGLVSLKAKDCGACHQEHYEEWLYSTHSHAWTDMQFQAELKKKTSPFMCINCHIPLQNQQEYIITGLINGDIYQPVKHINPQFDVELQKEGINCASCHVRDGYVIGPLGNTNAPHPVKKDTKHLSEQLCISCHNAAAVVTPTLVCSFETGDEWKSGPYNGKKNCISCHMQTISRPLVKGFPLRKSHRHYFAGSGIPKVDTAKTKMLNGLVYSSPKIVRLSNDSIKVQFTVTNANAGHRVPTGDPERYILTHVSIINIKSKKLKAQKIFRIGEKWKWHPKAQKIFDNNLDPLESRVYEVIFNVNKKEESNYRLHIKATKCRSTLKSKEYNKLPDSYPICVDFLDKEYSIK